MVTGKSDNTGLEHDLQLVLRRDGDTPEGVIRLELRYQSGNLQASRVFDRTDPRYRGSSREMLADAMKHLFAERRFRMKIASGFSVWYSEPLDRTIIERAAADYCADDKALRRYLDGLVARGHVLGETPRRP